MATEPSSSSVVMALLSHHRSELFLGKKKKKQTFDLSTASHRTPLGTVREKSPGPFQVYFAEVPYLKGGGTVPPQPLGAGGLWHGTHQTFSVWEWHSISRISTRYCFSYFLVQLQPGTAVGPHPSQSRTAEPWEFCPPAFPQESEDFRGGCSFPGELQQTANPEGKPCQGRAPRCFPGRNTFSSPF